MSITSTPAITLPQADARAQRTLQVSPCVHTLPLSCVENELSPMHTFDIYRLLTQREFSGCSVFNNPATSN